MKSLVSLVILAAILVHGYFYLNFGTFDACKAAAIRMISQPASEAGRALGSLVAGPIESRFRAKGVVTCYRAAVLGEDPNVLLQ
jgi:hypothetical protein